MRFIHHLGIHSPNTRKKALSYQGHLVPKDWPADAYAKLPEKPGIWWEDGKMHGSEEDRAVASKSVEGMLQVS